MDVTSSNGPITLESTIAVFVLDDHDIVVRGLVDVIDAEPDMYVVGTATTEHDAIRRIASMQPDVAVLDVRLVEGCGLNVCRSVTERFPAVASVMLTSIEDQRVLVESAAAGAAGLCRKSERAADIVDTIRAVASGARLLDAVALADSTIILDEVDEPAPSTLNEQEWQIVDLIGRGWSNRQIGIEMILAEKTVKNYVSRLLGKLGMSRRAEVAALAGRMAERRASWESLVTARAR